MNMGHNSHPSRDSQDIKCIDVLGEQADRENGAEGTATHLTQLGGSRSVGQWSLKSVVD